MTSTSAMEINCRTPSKFLPQILWRMVCTAFPTLKNVISFCFLHELWKQWMSKYSLCKATRIIICLWNISRFTPFFIIINIIIIIIFVISINVIITLALYFFLVASIAVGFFYKDLHELLNRTHLRGNKNSQTRWINCF